MRQKIRLKKKKCFEYDFRYFPNGFNGNQFNKMIHLFYTLSYNKFK